MDVKYEILKLETQGISCGKQPLVMSLQGANISLMRLRAMCSCQ